LLDLDLAEFVEIIDNVLSFEVAVTACRQAIKQLLSQQHSQKAAKYVSTDGLVGFVEDRPRGERRLEVSQLVSSRWCVRGR